MLTKDTINAKIATITDALLINSNFPLSLPIKTSNKIFIDKIKSKIGKTIYFLEIVNLTFLCNIYNILAFFPIHIYPNIELKS